MLNVIHPNATDISYATQPKSRRVLLVGGAGYIGGPLTTHLLNLGYHVRTLDLLVYQNANSVLAHMSHPRYEFQLGDMGNSEALERALRGVTDVVILAGLVGDPITKSFPHHAGAINEIALRKCIDALSGRGLGKVVFVSTCSNYGIIGKDEIADETFPLRPVSLYAQAKVAAERYIISLKRHVDYCPTILRFATAFGVAPRMRFDLTVNEFTRELFIGRGLEVYDADTWRPYCHVRDFARLISLVLDADPSAVAFEVFNAGGDENNHTKRDIAELVSRRLAGRRILYRKSSSDPRDYRVGFKKVRTRLGFEPAVTVGDGVEEILDALKSGFFSDAEERRTSYGNYDLPGLQRVSRPEQAHAAQ